jgi:hypothetical protein
METIFLKGISYLVSVPMDPDPANASGLAYAIPAYGQQFVIENRPGAGGNFATEAVS